MSKNKLSYWKNHPGSAGCIILGGTGTAYAANVGGIQRTVQIWLHGDQTQATLDVSNDGT